MCCRHRQRVRVQRDIRTLLEDRERRKNIDDLQKTLESARTLRIEDAVTKQLQMQLSIQQNKYVDFGALHQIVEEGDLRLLRGSWVADLRLLPRFRRQQELPADAFYSVADFFAQQSTLVVVALSYCWLHPVNPDPVTLTLQILRHSINLRLAVEGPGQVIDAALFVDYMSICQHGELGDPDAPVLGEERTPIEEQSFERALRLVNILYGNQQIETWMLLWTPNWVERGYNERAWPTFEKCVSSLAKHPAQLISIGKETLECCSWIHAYKSRVKRAPPYNPEKFKDIILTKHLTNEGDLESLLTCYQGAYLDVIGNARILWFVTQGWGDCEAGSIAEIFPSCTQLQQLLLCNNDFTIRGALTLVKASQNCKTLVAMDLSNNPITNVDAMMLVEAWEGAGKPEKGLRIDQGRASGIKNAENSLSMGNTLANAVANVSWQDMPEDALPIGNTLANTAGKAERMLIDLDAPAEDENAARP